MTKVEQLEKQYPHFNIGFLDFAKLFDKTKSNKYTPVICKIFSEFFNTMKLDRERMYHISKTLENFEIETQNLSPEEIWIYKCFIDSFDNSVYEIINDLIDYGERGLLKNKDILTYKTTEEIRNDITRASIVDTEKNFSKQTVKEFENDTWLAVRPLTYTASIKYGAATKWCTTSRYEKEYFARYWDRGVLVYFINKKTGYKFAGYKGIKNSDELSFWSAEDIDCESFLYDVIKNIFKSDKTNSDLCSPEIKSKVSDECRYVLYENQIKVSEEIAPDINYTHEIMVNENVGYIGIQNNLAITNTTYLNELETPTMRG